MSLLLSA